MNFYDIKLLNKTNLPQELTLKLGNIPGRIQMISGDTIKVGANSKMDHSFIVNLNRANLTGLKTEIEIEIYSGDKLIDNKEVFFSGPLIFK